MINKTDIPQINILGATLHKVDIEFLHEYIPVLLEEKKLSHIVTLNPEIIIGSRKKVGLKEYLDKAALCVADGIGLVLATKLLLGQPVNRITGVGIVEKLLKEQYSIYFVGARSDVLNQAIVNIKKTNPLLQIKGSHHGYLDPETEHRVIKEIKKVKPDIILVGMGFPRQEAFILELTENINHGIAIGVGGVLDILAGSKKRAPQFMQKSGLEWIYRGIIEPKRVLKWKFLITFIIIVLKTKIISFFSSSKKQ
jgi:N-acetylglucosaminyldiphosphoundecaprenol N-acetyl-beta-D-mannosaminyltransferase